MSSAGKRGGGPHLVPVTIYGQTYSLRADEDPAYVETLADFVDGRVREVAEKTRTADTGKIFILAALNIADELHRTGAGANRDDEAWIARLERMESLLDEALAPSS
jgi:cell division protein ZapA